MQIFTDGFSEISFMCRWDYVGYVDIEVALLFVPRKIVWPIFDIHLAHRDEKQSHLISPGIS